MVKSGSTFWFGGIMQKRRFEGKVVYITGAARGQGRSHAVHFAREGAHIAIFDLCKQIGSVVYKMSTDADLAETVRLCEAEGAEVISGKVDVRDYDAVNAFTHQVLDRWGRIDVLVANAAIFGNSRLVDMSPQTFRDMTDVNLMGVFNTLRCVAPAMLKRKYGRIVCVGSVCSVMGYPNVSHYVAAKHGVDGLVKALAHEFGGDGVTINLVAPNGVATDMILNQPTYNLVSPDNPTLEGAKPAFAWGNAIPLPYIAPEDVSKVVLFMSSDEAQYTTGSVVKCDLGRTSW